jgi:hypothetical protein
MVESAAAGSVKLDGDRSRSAIVERYFAAIHEGDYAAMEALLTPGAVTRWPQSGEQITGAMTCIRVYQEYPGGPPVYRIGRVTGAGDVWVAELEVDYGAERWYMTSICEFEGDRIARITDYFAPSLPAPEWRSQFVDPAV